MSDNGLQALTVIGFVGSVFSPYYAWARRGGAAAPEDFCAVNCVLYGLGSKHWAMMERRAASLRRDATTLAIGPSALRWTGAGLEIDLDEIGVPWPRRIRGTIRLSAEALCRRTVALDPAGRHAWRPIAPLARVDVRMERPQATWQGHGYFDMNWGSEPLERGFRRWHWSRARAIDGAAILYGGDYRDGGSFDLALVCDRHGRVLDRPPPPRHRLPATLWQVGRETGGDVQAAPKVVRTLEDTPFYARSLVHGALHGERLTMMHESLDLDRFANPVVQAMLPFRMPRRF